MVYLVLKRTFLRNCDTGEEVVLEKTSYGDGFMNFEDAAECLDKVLGSHISTLLGSSFEKTEGSCRVQVDIECDEETESRSVQILNFGVSPGCVYGMEWMLFTVE